MKHYLFLAAALLLACCSACNKDKKDKPKTEPPSVVLPGNGRFTDHGFIPVSTDMSHAELQSAFFYKGFVYVATSDGVWKNELRTKTWSRAGLEGKVITCLFRNPYVPGKFFAGVEPEAGTGSKTLYLSDDGGNNWHAAAAPVFDDVDKRYELYFCLAVRPAYPGHIYANLHGATIAVSTDGGEHWERMNRMPASTLGGYPCYLVFLPDNSNKIFQGAESWLDIAVLTSHTIGATDRVLLSDFTFVIDHNTWGNRRPSEMQTYPFTGNSIYIGQEGALSKVNGSSNKFIFKSEEGSPFPYSYIYGIWVDPADPAHLLFGGALNNPVQPMSLYETCGEGDTIFRFEDKFGTEAPEIKEIVATDQAPAIIINDRSLKKVKLVLYKPGA